MVIICLTCRLFIKTFKSFKCQDLFHIIRLCKLRVSMNTGHSRVSKTADETAVLFSMSLIFFNI
jgi:hypothetical protein